MRPASAAQQRLCAIDELAVDGRGHAVSVAWELTGPVDEERLRRALRDCQTRYEILRSRFVVDGILRVLVEPVAEPPLEVLERPGATEAVVAELAARPMPRDRAPLLRVHLVRLGPERHFLVLSAHRAVADAVALTRLTELLLTGEGDQWPPPGTREHPAPDRRTVLDGGPGADLRTDLPRPATPSYRGATRSLSLDTDLAARLRGLAELPTALLAGVLVVLSRYQGRPDVLVEFGAAPLRGDLSGPLSWHELVAQVAAARRRTQEVSVRGPADGPGRKPIAQVGFGVVPGLARMPAGLRARWIPVDDPVAVFDLEWSVHDATVVTCALRWARDLWEPATVDRLAAAWLQVLQAIATDPEGQVSDLDLVSPAERDRLDRWNRTARPLPEPATVDGQVCSWARRTPDAVAVTEGATSWTYAELEGRATQVARALVAAGVGVDSRVGIHLRRGAELVVAMLGVLKAGGCYLVLDPAQPAERLAFMAGDCQVTAVLTGTEQPPWLAGSGVPVIALASTAGQETSGLPPRSLPGGLGAVMYTSGSTGRPKGVAVEHRGMIRLITATDYVAIGPDDLLVHLGDPSFDIAIFEVWGALCNGARVEVLPGAEQLGPEEVLSLLTRCRPTVFALTSTLFNRVVDLDAAAFGALRYLFVVGEVMDPVRTRRVLGTGAPGHMLNGYGPTENTTFSTCHLITEVPERAAGVPIGSAIANTTLYVVDELMRPVPVGFPGELYVGGAGLARGYLSRPGLTADRFGPDPFAAGPAGRLYRTGDLVRWRPDGALEFLGRMDQQVKVRGYRIETGEIEAALLATGAVRECVVRLVDVSGDNRLVAYVVGRAGPEIRVGEVIAELSRRLPAFMIPNHFIALDHLPTTSSGKLDVRALPGVAASLPLSEVDRTAPRDPLERAVWEIWAEILQIREFGVHDNFFLLGGHSLLAIVVVTEVAGRLGEEIPARVIFETRTVAGLAAEIERRRAVRPGGPPDEVDALVRQIEQLSRQEGNVS